MPVNQEHCFAMKQSEQSEHLPQCSALNSSRSLRLLHEGNITIFLHPYMMLLQFYTWLQIREQELRDQSIKTNVTGYGITAFNVTMLTQVP